MSSQKTVFVHALKPTIRSLHADHVAEVAELQAEHAAEVAELQAELSTTHSPGTTAVDTAYTHNTFATQQSPFDPQPHQMHTADLEARLRTAELLRDAVECKQTRLRAELVAAQEHHSKLAAALAANQAALASALASTQNKPDRWHTATQQVLSSASDIIGTSTAAQLLERIQTQVTALGVTSTTTPQPPIILTGSSMYIGRGAPRRSDYRKPNDELLKPCVSLSPESSVLYKLPDGSVLSLGSLSTA